MASFLKFGNKAMKTQHHLDEYRQHKEVHVYRPVRWLGYGSSLAALSFGIFALVNRSWLKAEIAGTGTCVFDEVPLWMVLHLSYSWALPIDICTLYFCHWDV